MKISRFIELYKNFGGDIAFSALAASRFWKMNYVKHRKILNYLENKYADFIKNYKPQKPLSVLSKVEFIVLLFLVEVVLVALVALTPKVFEPLNCSQSLFTF